MGNSTENSNYQFSTILFICIISIFAVVFSGNKYEQNLNSLNSPDTHKTTYLIKSDNLSGTVSNAPHVADFQRFITILPANKTFPAFSIKRKLSDFNRNSIRNYFQVRLERFHFAPDLIRKSLKQLPIREPGDIPQLG